MSNIDLSKKYEIILQLMISSRITDEYDVPSPRFEKIAKDYNTSRDDLQELWAKKEKIISNAKMHMSKPLREGMESQIKQTFFKRASDTFEKIHSVDYDDLSERKVSALWRINVELTYIMKELKAI